MTFKETVQSMTAKEIIMAMVNSLIPPPVIPVDMGTFGTTREEPAVKFLGITVIKPKVKCYGCAATNTICKIAGKTFTIDNIYNREGRADFIGTDTGFLGDFEAAIDKLRTGNVRMYNTYARFGGFAEIQNVINLPCLNDNYTTGQLNKYKQLADAQPVLQKVEV